MSTLALVAGLAPAVVQAQSLASLQQQLARPQAARSAAAGLAGTTSAAQAVAAQSGQNLQRALQALQSHPTASAAAQLQARQTAAANYTASCTTPGPLCGLQPDTSSGATWLNVTVQSKDTSGATPVETLKQTAGKAIATWQTLNLAPGEVLDIVQPGSGSILLNRINDSNPSQIFGSIKANGQVYLINHNGIIFGGTSQIDVHALIATSLDIGPQVQIVNGVAQALTIEDRDNFFLTQGIGKTQGAVPANLVLGDFSACRDATCGKLSGPFEGSVVVAAGAQITTSVTAETGSPEETNFVYLFAPYVRNDGTITSPKGEVLLGAGQNFTLTPQSNGQTYNQAGGILLGETTPGFARATGLLADSSSNAWLDIGPGNASVDASFRPSASGSIPVGTITNTGIIQTPLGTTFIAGTTIEQRGIIEADTGVERNGSIILQAATGLTLGSSSALIVLPFNDTPTPVSAGGASPFQAPVVRLSGQLIDLQGTQTGAGATIYAPGASISLTTRADSTNYNPAAGVVGPANGIERVFLDQGSLIDVSGTIDDLPMSDNFVTFQPRGQEFADSPLQRQGLLRGQDLTVDIRTSGVRADGFQWIGTPLADASGFVALIPRDINYLLATAGNVTLTSGGGAVVTQPGSVIAFNGGLIRYQGGMVQTTQLLGADGRIVNIGAADPLATYVGIAGSQTVVSSKWSITSVYTNTLLNQAHFEPGYTDGRNAGGLTVSGAQGAFLGGSISGAAVVGARQALGTDKNNPAPSAGSLTITNNFSTSGPAQGNASICVFAATACDPASPIAAAPTSVDAPLATADLFLSAAALTDAGLGQVSLSAEGTVAVAAGATLAVAPGNGAIALTGFNVDIEGTLRANAGRISVTANGEGNTRPLPRQPTVTGITVGVGGVVDASGVWVNDTGANGDAVVGSRAINGGSITLKTQLRTSNAQTDVTGSITLQAGSLLDVSSGGYVQPNGRQLLDAPGRPAGKGGNLTLAVGFGAYQPHDPFNPTPPEAAPPSTPLQANVVIDGTIRGFGFAQGGTLTLQVPTVRIGGAGQGDPGEFDIDPARFFGNGTSASPGFGFASFALTAIAGGITVQPGTDIVLRQVNYVPTTALLTQATGAPIVGVAGLGVQADFLRSAGPSGLTLTDAALLDAPAPAHTTPGILIGAGAQILADPGATVNLVSNAVLAGSNPNAQPFREIDVFGSIVAPGGTIGIDAPSTMPTLVTLGSASRLDASGVALIDPRQPFATGTVLQGGSVTVSLQTQGSVFAGAVGSVIDVSGAAATFDLPTAAANGIGTTLVPSPVWSDGGSITINAETVLYAGLYVGRPGAPSGNGGSLTLGGPTADAKFKAVVVAVDGTAIAAATASTPPSLFDDTATLILGSLAGSGIANLTLDANTGSSKGDLVLFGDRVALQVPGSLVVDAQRIIMAPGTVGTAQSDLIAAGYIDLRNSAPVSGTPKSYANLYPTFPGGTLTVAAAAIDLEGVALGLGSEDHAHANIATTNFISSGDIRLSVPLNDRDGTQLANLFSEVTSSGDITFDAAQVYPVSGVDAAIKSLGTVLFEQNGPTPSVPLSAGGRLTVDAVHIVQNGTVRAPLGTIALGARSIADLSPNDPDAVTLQQSFTGTITTTPNPSAFILTQDVTLGAGSLTSVSLDGAIVPFGHTTDGGLLSFFTQRFANPQATKPQNTASLALTQAPSKQVLLSGTSVALSAGSVVDVSGGGDISAIEFVAGTGGSRDVLAPTYLANNGTTLPQFPNGRAIYAVVPGFKGSVAPTDFDFSQNYGDTQPAAGSAVFLSGGPGLPAGVYTLLPAHYATLPGAFRVVVQSQGNNALASQNTVLADGTMLVSGFTTNTLTGSRAAQTSLFSVQSSSVWRQYSQIDTRLGTTFFGAANAKNGTVNPVPADAGKLVVAATQQLSVEGTFLASGDASRNGRAGEVDIAAQDIEILGSGGSAPLLPGYISIDNDGLNRLAGTGASLVIGGTTAFGAGSVEIVTPVANSVVVSNSAADPLSAASVLLVAQPIGGDGNSGNGLILAAGSTIVASGTVVPGGPSTISLGSAGQAGSGDGALLRVANGAQVNVVRGNVPATPLGTLTIGAGVTLAGDAIVLSSSGNAAIATTVTLRGSGTGAPDIAIAAANIGFDVPVASGLDIVTADASGAATGLFQSLLGASRLRFAAGSGGSIAFGGPLALTLGAPAGEIDLDAATVESFGGLALNGGTVTVAAGTVRLANSGVAAPSGQIGNASFAVTANEIDLDPGSKILAGFGTVTLSANGAVIVNGAGVLDAGNAAVTLATPQVLVATGATQTVKTAGALVLSGGSGGAVPSAVIAGEEQIGGSLTLIGGSVSDGTTIQAIAGQIALEATSGDLSLASNAQILAPGAAQRFFDVVSVAGGGAVSLVSDVGNVAAAAGAVVDVSAASDPSLPQVASLADAGQIVVRAVGGDVSIATATLRGAASTTGAGGGFTVDGNTLGGGSASGLDDLARGLSTGGFTNKIDIRTRQGDLTLSQNLVANAVSLTADGGAVNVAATIDASGSNGGTITLIGRTGVDIGAGTLKADATGSNGSGGTVALSTLCNFGGCGGIALGATTIDVSGTGSGAGGVVQLEAPFFFGANGFDIAIKAGSANIIGARSVNVVVNKVIDAANFVAGSSNPDQMFDGILDPSGVFDAASKTLLTSVLPDYMQSQFPTLVLPGIEARFDGIKINGTTIASAAAATTNGVAVVAGTGGTSAQLVFEPGIEFDNTSNGPFFAPGSIVLASSWNLAAVDANGRALYRVGGSLTGAAGVLTLRAAGDIDIGANFGQSVYASLTDGFVGVGATANSASPTPGEIGGATVFAAATNPDGTLAALDHQRQSWSYNLVAGADFTSANKLAVRPVSVAGGGGTGNVNLQATPVGATPTLVRTGTGAIAIAAAGNVDLCAVGSSLCQQSTTGLQPGAIYTAGLDTVDPAGFTRPTTAGCFFCIPAGPFSIAYPTGGGDLSVIAQGSINGFQAVTSNGTPFYQFWAPWLPAGFDPATGNPTWGINFAGFDQGLMSAGGNVQIVAGQDLNQLSVSLPTTARVVGSGSSLALDITHSGNLRVSVGGDIGSGAFYVGDGTGEIRVGGAVVPAWSSGNVGPADPGNLQNQQNTSGAGFIPTAQNMVPTVLAVDNGSLSLVARGSISLAGVVSPISLENLSGVVVNNEQNHASTEFMSSYGPASAVMVQSVAGEIALNGYIDPATHEVVAYNPLPLYAYGSAIGSLPGTDIPFGVGANAYPVTFEAAALRGDLTVAGSLQMAPSNDGQLDLLADKSLAFSAPFTGVNPQVGGQAGVSFADAISAQAVISTGPALLPSKFDPFMPWWNAIGAAGSSTFSYPADTGVTLLHQGDSVPDRFCARLGDIVDGPGQSSSALEALGLEITKASEIQAGRDIVDLAFFGANLSSSDVTSIVAGRDLFYTGKNNAGPIKNVFNRSTPLGDTSIATLRIAGPGFFDVEAGRNLGPFLLGSTLGEGQGVVAIGNAAETAGFRPTDGGVVGNRILASENGPNPIDPTLVGFAPASLAQLPRQSASISLSFSVAPNGTNAVAFQAFIDAYINPANNPPRDYSPELVSFLNSIDPAILAQSGGGAVTPANAFAAFTQLPTRLQDEFARQVFFDELKLVGDPAGCCLNQTAVGLKAIATLFPAANGFVGANNTGGVASGDLNLLHSTVQTQLGGGISIMGPAGSIILGTIEQPTVTVGKLVTPVPLKNEGILTLAGGAIQMFSDGSVEVNQSRIFTEQGGDVVIWSTNGDIDAGRGAKTTASFPPLAVTFPVDDTEVVDLAGLVTGAGIAVLQSTPEAPASNAFLIAPRGIVNAGDAGIRVSGNLAISAAQVENASNIAVGGNKTGVPTTVSVNLGSAEAASAAATSATKVAQDAERAQQARPQAQAVPSLITVEVLSYGGISADDPRLKNYDCSTRKGPGC